MNVSKTPIKHSQEEGVGFLFLLLRYLGIKLKGVFALMTCVILIILLNNQNELSHKIKINLQDFIYTSYQNISNTTYKLKHIPQYFSTLLSYYLPLPTSYEYEELAQENTTLKEKIQQLEVELSENKRLHELLNYHDKPNPTVFLTTRIISKNTSQGNTLFVINAGHNQGIEEGDIALSGNALAGKVIETSPNTSVIVSITDSNSKISGLILPSHSKCLILGNGGIQNLEIFSLSKTDNTGNNNLIITSGDGGIFPYGIPIANLQIQDNYLTALPIFDFVNLEFVHVIKNIKVKNHFHK